jgi:hypothetical protein
MLPTPLCRHSSRFAVRRTDFADLANGLASVTALLDATGIVEDRYGSFGDTGRATLPPGTSQSTQPWSETTHPALRAGAPACVTRRPARSRLRPAPPRRLAAALAC